MLLERPVRSAANVRAKPTPAQRPHTSDEYRSAKPPRWTKSRARRQPPLPPFHRTTIQFPKCASLSDTLRTKLQFQILQVFAEGGAQLFISQRDFDGCFQESQFVTRIIGYAVVNVSPEPLFVRQDAQRVRQLNFISCARLGTLQAIENLRRQHVA